MGGPKRTIIGANSDNFRLLIADSLSPERIDISNIGKVPGCCIMFVEAPVVRVSNVQSRVLQSRAVQLTWDPVSCSQQLGLRPRYDILVVDSSSQGVVVNTSKSSPPPHWLYALQPYTQYTVRVRYANEYGTAAYSRDLHITSEPDGSYTRFVYTQTVFCSNIV